MYFSYWFDIFDPEELIGCREYNSVFPIWLEVCKNLTRRVNYISILSEEFSKFISLSRTIYKQKKVNKASKTKLMNFLNRFGSNVSTGKVLTRLRLRLLNPRNKYSSGPVIKKELFFAASVCWIRIRIRRCRRKRDHSKNGIIHFVIPIFWLRFLLCPFRPRALECRK